MPEDKPMVLIPLSEYTGLQNENERMRAENEQLRKMVIQARMDVYKTLPPEESPLVKNCPSCDD